MTGASVTNKGIYYETGKEPPAEGPPKLHLLIESNEEFRVSVKSYCPAIVILNGIPPPTG